MHFRPLLIQLVALSLLAPAAHAWGGKVVSVTDGDTIRVLKHGASSSVAVRLYGIDAPEKNQQYGHEAAEFTAGMVAGKNVEVQTSGGDRYGRVIGLVTVNGVLLNRETVRAGYAWVYRRYCRKAFLCAELEALETMAREAGAGVFQDDAPVRPSIFRKGGS
jgi:endonuclease YncB( thermonuclease family)